jgi:hypothetical protein
VPAWYGVIAAAHYLHVPPWELMERPAIWTNWALTAHSAEQQAQAEIMAERFKGK